MKLYTEEQVKEAMFLYRAPIRPLVQQVLEQLTPIELPSDEEVVNKSKTIDKDGLSWENDFARDSFVAGAKWMKEQIFGKEDKTFKRKSQWTEVDNMTRRLK